MTNILIIYNNFSSEKEINKNITEINETYIIKGVNKEDLEIIMRCHNCIINTSTENESCYKLYYWLFDIDLLIKNNIYDENWHNEYWSKKANLPKEELGKLSKNKRIYHKSINCEVIDKIILTGFYV